MSSKRLYFDYAATTPVDPEIVEAMAPYWNERFGNPGSLHSFGQEAMNAVDHAREALAGAIGASFCEIVFTASATEANQLGIIGTVRKFRRDHPEATARPRVVLSAIEHPSARAAVRSVVGDDDKAAGIEIVEIPVDREGRVDPRAVLDVVTPETALVFLMYGHNEIGTVQPVAEIARGVAALRKEGKTFARLHVDAVQAFPFLSCAVDDLGVDLLTISAQKIYGPKGSAALYVRGLDTPRQVPLVPLVAGSGQEFGMRSGTENVPAIVGFGRAVELLLTRRDFDEKRLRALRQYCWNELRTAIPALEVNGPDPASNEAAVAALPHILNVYLPGHASQDLLTALDLHGIAVSAGSACSARSLEPSRVIETLGHSRERASSSIRISFGRQTTKEEVDELVQVLRSVI